MGSAAFAAASWQCQRCSHTNIAEKNKRRCFLCRGWRDGIAPNTAGIAIAKEEAGRGRPRLSVTTADKNDAPNGVSPHKGDHPTKRGEKRKSPSQGLGGMVLHPLPLPLPLTIRPTHSITPPPPSQFRSLPQEGIAGEEPQQLKMCSGVSVGNLGANLTAAAAVYEHTARCLLDFASNQDF